MNHSVKNVVVTQFSRNLEALREILMKARQFAADRKFDENKFLDLRLAPDMFPLVRQVQITTDIAKGAASRLAGKTAPSFPDDEKTLEQLIQRIGKTVEYINGFKEEDFKNYHTQQISFPWNPGVHLMGDEFFASHAIPNLYFHITTTYALLRQCGVQIGKGDYLGKQNWIK